jgi:hypothetical protein
VPSYTVGYIDVYRNGVRLVSTDFTATTGTTVVLNNACTVGDAVVTESFYVSSVLNAIPATAGAVAGSYLAGGAVTLTTQVTGILPVANGGTGLSAGGPAFSAYRGSSNQNVSTGTWTKAQLNTEDFDTASAFDSTTNYRFTPLIAGYYQINGSISPDSTSAFGNGVQAAIYKNGTLYRVGSSYNISATLASTPTVTTVVYLNGSTDYVELYGYFVGGSGMQFATTNNSTSLSGCLVRAA